MDSTALMTVLSHPFQLMLAAVVVYHAVRPLFAFRTRVIRLRALGASA